MASSFVVSWILLFSIFCSSLGNGGVQAKRLAPGGKATTQVRSHPNIIPTDQGEELKQEWAVCFSQGHEFHGAKATLSVHGLPDIQSNQTSTSAMWVNEGFPDSFSENETFNSIQAGWHVNPELYGDTETRFFTYWTLDFNGKSGCYNLLCPGFVTVSGSPMQPGSILTIHENEEQYMTLTIIQQRDTRDWWLYYSDNVNPQIPIGYWPKSLFTSLVSKANQIQYGGLVTYLEDTQRPPMGSGHYYNEGTGKAAFVKDMQFMDVDGSFKDFWDLEAYAQPCYVADLIRVYGGELVLDFGGSGSC